MTASKPLRRHWRTAPDAQIASVLRDARRSVCLYRPLIADLLIQRDRRLARRADPALPLDNRQLELLSLIPIDWAADLDALEAEAARRATADARDPKSANRRTT